MSKTYEPHVIIVWVRPEIGSEIAAVKEIPYREDAYEKYNNLIEGGATKIALAKVVKKHGEG
jgi:hypothetical protein